MNRHSQKGERGSSTRQARWFPPRIDSMAKKSKSISFSNATIDLEMRTIEEIKKDSVLVTSLDEVLNEWNGVPGISILIKQDVQCGGSESEINN